MLRKTNITNEQNDGTLFEQQMKQYLSGAMSAAEQHQFELQLEEDDFARDALDGFVERNISAASINEAQSSINKALWAHIAKSKKQKKQHPAPLMSKSLWIYILVVLIILIICYVVFFSITSK